MGTLVAALTIAAGLLGVATSTAAAHGILVASEPSANATLTSGPGRVVLRFNEPLDPKFSSATIVDAGGTRVSGGVTVSADRQQLAIALDRGLADGVYTVRWRALWSLDGHTTSGFFFFSVGEAAGRAGAPSTTTLPGPLRLVVRWAAYAAALVLIGSVFFRPAVLIPALAQLDPDDGGRLGAPAFRLLTPMTRATALVLFLSVVVEFGLQVTELLDASVLQVLQGGLLWPLLGGTKTGWSALLRGVLALVLLLPASPRGRILQAGVLVWVLLFGAVTTLAGGPAALVGVGDAGLPILLSAHVYALATVMAALIIPAVPGARVPEMPWVPAFAAPLIPLGITIGSHASGEGLLAMAVDWAHLLAASIWVGGLATLLLVLRAARAADRDRLAQVLVPRFSRLAGFSLGALVITGLYSTWLYVPHLRAFALTDYGRTLLLKLALVVPLAGLGVYNHFVVRPRLLRSASPAFVHRLLRTVTGEVGFGALILVVVAVLTITPPAKVALPAPVREPLTLAGLAQDVRVRLRLAPVRAGGDRYEVVVLGASDDSPVAGGRVMVRLLKLDEELDPATLVLVEQGPGQYVGESRALALGGWWQVEVVVRRRGRLDVSVSFPLALDGPGAVTSDPEAIRLLTAAIKQGQALRAWREVQQITDGSGGSVAAVAEWVSPDRLRLTGAGQETRIIGTNRYQQVEPGRWERDTLPSPVTVTGPLGPYAQQPEAVRLGREADCSREECRIVLWSLQGGAARFAGWVGVESALVHRLLMVAPSHYMTVRFDRFNDSIQIVPPP